MYYIPILDMFGAILCSSSGGLNCIVTASGIVTRPYSAPVESGLQSALNRCTVRPLTESEWLDRFGLTIPQQSHHDENTST
jgi:hypothetical protein